MANLGNTFKTGSAKHPHARKIWHRVTGVYPGGGVITNAGDMIKTYPGVIPAGTALKKVSAGKYSVIPPASISGATDAAAVNALGIIGFTENDTYFASKDDIGTCTVVYAGELNAYMIDSAVEAKLELASLGQVKLVD